MRPFDDSLFLTPEQRFQQIAGLLARGLLRSNPGPRVLPLLGNIPPPKILRILVQVALSFLRKPCSVSIRVNAPQRSPERRTAWT